MNFSRVSEVIILIAILIDNINSFVYKRNYWKKTNEASFELIKTLTSHSDSARALAVLPNNM